MKNTFNYKTAFRILKGGKVSMVVSAFLAGATISFASPATNALPTNGNVVNGNVNISTNANTMNINQASNKSIINWNTYNIGKDSTVNYNFAQTNSSSLNRVTSNNPSEIYGNLNANGKVILVNPNGVVFGKGSSVNVGSLVATTMNVKDSDYLNDKQVFTRDNAIGSIINEGTITAQEKGYIALLSPKVLNEGVIRAVKGTVSLSGANKIELTLDSSGLKTVIVEPSTIATLIENKSLVEADGGIIYIGVKQAAQLLDTAMNIKNSGTLQANSMDDLLGKVTLDGDNIEVSGIIQAKDGVVYVGNQNNNKTIIKSTASLEGKFVETSGKTLKVEDGVKIKANEWLLDPTDITIAAGGSDIAGSSISSATISSYLNNTGNLTLTADNDINVNQALSWSANTLTLTAGNDINIHAVVTASGTAGLTMNTSMASGKGVKVGIDANGAFAGRVDMTGSGGLTINGDVYTRINNVTELQAINNNVENISGDDYVTGNYYLGANIDASRVNFVPLGVKDFDDTNYEWITNTPFAGNFQGFGHTISNLTINTSSAIKSTGLFGTIELPSGETSFIGNVGLINADITGNENVGGLIGYINTTKPITVSNAYVKGTVASDDTAGGLIGKIKSGTVLNTYADTTVTSAGVAGGLIGEVSGGSVGAKISSSYSKGSVSGSEEVGGFVGKFSSWMDQVSGYPIVWIDNSYSQSSATGDTGAEAVGGFAGLIEAYAKITNSYSTGTASGDGEKGGFAGQVVSLRLQEAPNSGDVNWDPVLVNNFWDIETSGKTVGLNIGRYDDAFNLPFVANNGSTGTVEGKTTAQMKTLTTYTGTTPTWDIDGDDSGAYPTLTMGGNKVWNIYSPNGNLDGELIIEKVSNKNDYQSIIESIITKSQDNLVSLSNNVKNNLIVKPTVIEQKAKVVEEVNSQGVTTLTSNANPFNTNEQIEVENGGVQNNSSEEKIVEKDSRSKTLNVAELTISKTSNKIIAKVNPTEKSGFTFTVKEAVNVRIDAKETKSITATSQNGTAIPSWLKFDKTTQTFSAINPPAGSLPISVKVNITGANKTETISVDIIK